MNLCGTCGHELASHYEYQLNGRPQTRCRECDPHTNRTDMPTNYAMTEGSHESMMYRAADHDFVARR